MKKVSVIAAAVAATLAAGSAFAVDFNGYFRAGTGISGNGDADISFQKKVLVVLVTKTTTTMSLVFQKS